jgi:hypothetical protein
MVNINEENHKCYIKKLKAKDIKPPQTRVIYYDYETYTDKETMLHVPCLIVAFRDDSDVLTKHIFYTNEEFCQWLFTKKNEGFVCIAHNSKGYDIHFIKHYLRMAEKPIQYEPIDVGNKTLMLSIPALKMRFLDSMAFISGPLRAFPKMFDLKDIKKGDFPHMFSSKDTLDYVGNYPEKKYYGYDTMDEKDKKSFNDWYETKKGCVFDFKKEMLEYCIADVDILYRGFNAFRKIYMDILKVHLNPIGENNVAIPDPLNHITIAG